MYIYVLCITVNLSKKIVCDLMILILHVISTAVDYCFACGTLLFYQNTTQNNNNNNNKYNVKAYKLL